MNKLVDTSQKQDGAILITSGQSETDEDDDNFSLESSKKSEDSIIHATPKSRFVSKKTK